MGLAYLVSGEAAVPAKSKRDSAGVQITQIKSLVARGLIFVMLQQLSEKAHAMLNVKRWVSIKNSLHFK
jgi:hypothetical protein